VAGSPAFMRAAAWPRPTTRTLSAHTAPSLHLHLHPGDLGHEYRNDGVTAARFALTVYEPAGHGR
jgi:hypothetical protein